MTAKLNATDLQNVQSALKCCGAGFDGTPTGGVPCSKDELDSKLGCAQVRVLAIHSPELTTFYPLLLFVRKNDEI